MTTPGMPQPAYYIFKCQQSAPPGMPKPSCVRQDDPESQQLFQHLAQQLMMKGIIGTVQPVQTGCLGRCQQGPVMLVEPGHTMYVNLTKEKIDRIIEEHILGGKVVEEYVIPEEFWGEPVNPSEMAR
ncbi:(2Fe-2S) ferredoxin domain-containing protein [Nitratifractor sp.]|uniref:(2Fe-2S) ferredoxin domain-containing protein n=1 Tax=Nitratifractor sp. TaxID=2268144 RepID=UPI0025D18A4D|nr:(2Fe-2S) ferredoxin domain-containing protein [Nitratifractor sp.]